MKTGRTVIAVGLGIYLLGFGILVGSALERFRFDRQRTAVLTRYEQALSKRHEYQMALEKDATSTRHEPRTQGSRP